jgi:hypothetical protein
MLKYSDKLSEKFEMTNHAINNAILWIAFLFHHRHNNCLCNHDAPDDVCHAKNDYSGRMLPLLP